MIASSRSPPGKALLISGTPFLNRPDELYTQISYLDPTNWPSFKSFIKQYYEDDARSDDLRRVTGQACNLDRLQQKLRSTIMVRQLKQDVFDLPPKHYEVKWVDATELSGALLGWFRTKRRQIII